MARKGTAAGDDCVPQKISIIPCGAFFRALPVSLVLNIRSVFTFLPSTIPDPPGSRTDWLHTRLKAMHTFSSSLGREVELFELALVGAPLVNEEQQVPFDAHIPDEQLLRIFPNEDYAVRIVDRNQLQVHKYRACSFFLSSVVISLLLPINVLIEC